MKKTTTLLIGCSVLTPSLIYQKVFCQDNKRPNIIFIMSDDHAYQAISAYKSPLAKLAPTPNIDRIANEGMRFDQCFVTNSLSGPSRACILTGKYSHLNGFVDNRLDRKFDGSQLTFPKVLQEAGYQTAIIGKWHLGSVPTGFDFWDIIQNQGSYYNPNFINSGGKYNEPGYVTEIITEKSIQWLKKAKESGKPFVLMMHHKAPHRTWKPGPHELGLYENVTFPEPTTLFDDYANRGTAEHTQDMTIAKTMTLDDDLKLTKEKPKVNIFGKPLTTEQWRLWDSIYHPIIDNFNSSNLKGNALVSYKYQRYMRDYLACVAGVDKSVGEVLDFLKKSGLDKNTIVIYTSDQGFFLGEHGWFDKRWMFKESLKTPLLIKWPGVIKHGSVNDDIVSNLDFAETFINIAGAKIPAEMQGKSLLPIFEGKTPKDWRKEFYYHFYEYPGDHSVKRHYGITTNRYKLIHFYYDINEWELFDLKKDPNEMRNVYKDVAYKQIRKILSDKLESLRIKYKDSEALQKKFVTEP